MGDGRDWLYIISQLSDKYYCITIDLPGHGDSTNHKQLWDEWNFDIFSKKLSSLLTHLKIETAALIGYSMGGRAALAFTIKYPELISKLILESTSPGIEKTEERQDRLQLDNKLATKLQTGSFADFLHNWYDLPLFSGIKRHTSYPVLLEKRTQNNPQLLAKALESFSPAKEPSYWKELSNLKIPVNLICGENDEKYLAIMTKFKNINQHFDLKIFKNCAHNIHFEQPVQFAEHLLQVLSL